MNLREQYFAALKESQRKQLLSKSAVAPPVLCIRNGAEIVGFGVGEPASVEEVARQVALSKQLVSKSADTDPNAVFDDSPLLPILQSIGRDPVPQVVKKSAGIDPNSILEGLFPQWLQNR